MDIDGSGALISGGASGLGEATARHLTALGAQVTILDVNTDKGNALAEEIGVLFVEGDVREEAHVQAAVDAAADAPGGLRFGIACAGTDLPQKIAGSKGPAKQDVFETILAINLTGTFNVWRLAAQKMLDNQPNEGGERGVLIGTASVAAYEGQVGQINYSASKGAIVGMTLPAARDLAPKGIRVNTIAPGLFNTPLLAALPEEAKESLGKQVPFPPRLGEPYEYAQLVEAILVNPMLNGQTIRIDGAIRMQPR